eukprot:824873-Prorocentrum_minimum.AAC.5
MDPSRPQNEFCHIHVAVPQKQRLASGRKPHTTGMPSSERSKASFLERSTSTMSSATKHRNNSLNNSLNNVPEDEPVEMDGRPEPLRAEGSRLMFHSQSNTTIDNPLNSARSVGSEPRRSMEEAQEPQFLGGASMPPSVQTRIQVRMASGGVRSGSGGGPEG